MEPIAAQNHPIAIRPSLASQPPELTALLREGRVLAGEVLQTLGHGTFLIGIGRHRVPAQTNLRLDPGHHFLFQVELAGDTLLLRILGEGLAESDLLRYLRRVIGEDRPIGELLAELAGRVRAELERPGAEQERLRTLLVRLRSHAFQPGAGGRELEALLGRSGLRYEAALLAAAQGTLGQGALEALGRDLKGELLRALADLPEGALREAVGRTLAGLEAEQLLNQARRQAGEPLLFSFPFPDGPDGPGGLAWTTARLLVASREEREGDEAGSEEVEELQRVVLGVSFSNTGPIRADLTLAPGSLGVSLVVSRPELADRLRRDFEGLAERLLRGERTVRLSVRVGSPEDVAVGTRPLDTQLLRDHRLMDVSG